jgi:hypothetical protein
MLNFLISVIGETYTRITERSKMHTYRYRNQLNIEYLRIRDKFRTPLKVSCMLLVTDNDKYQFEHSEYKDMKEEIVEIIHQSRQETKEQIDAMGSRLEKVDTNIQDIKDMITNMVKKD